MHILYSTIYSDVDDVHDIMDDIQEQTEIANEISNALSQPVGFQDVDEVKYLHCSIIFCSHMVCCDLQDELLQELEELEQEEVEKDLLEVGPTSTELPGLDNLPEVRKYLLLYISDQIL